MAHIVLDVRIIETSTGRYMQRLVEHINDRYTDDGNKYTALMPSQYVAKWQSRLPNVQVIASDARWYTFAEQWQLYWQLRRLRPDLVHFTMPQQPLLWTGPAVTTIHDMTLIRFENIDESDNPIIYKFKKLVFDILIRIVMQRGRAIITPTNFVREDLARLYGQRYLPKIHVTYEAGETPEVDPEPLLDFEGVEYICTVGNMFPYKNVQRVILAFEQLAHDYPNLHLLCAGKKDSFAVKIEQLAAERRIPRVHFLGFISDGQKRWLYQNSKAYVSASLSEGFCIPVLEAMIEGCPTVLADASCLPETGGDAARYFDPHSTADCARAISEVVGDESLRQEMTTSGVAHVGKFSWAKMTDETYDVYRSIIDKQPSSIRS